MRNSVSSEKAVIVRLIGGLGNQMFQYATARALAMSKGAALKLDLSGFKTYELRRYELGTYRIDATVATPEELTAFGGAKNSTRAFFMRLFGSRNTAVTANYREPHFHFDPNLADQPLPLYMDGYWQSERYFQGVANDIRAELQPTKPLEPENAEMAAQINGVQAVSLHVRRGDYVTNPHTNANHGTASLDYYAAAIDEMRSRVNDPHLFVFSDDSEWTRNNIKSDLPTTYVTANPPDCGYRDMQLMNRCQHHIIANSSFSWWGAWLNPSPDKVVVAPKNWFTSQDKNTADLIPEGWIRL